MAATVTPIDKKTEVPADPPMPRRCAACDAVLPKDAPTSRVYCSTEACRKARANEASRRSRSKQSPSADAFISALETATVRAERMDGPVTLTDDQLAAISELSKRLTASTRKIIATK